MIDRSTDNIYRGLMLMLDSCSTETVSIKNYEIQIFRFVFHAYSSYLYRVSFLTTLDIYKDYFKGHQRWCKVMQLNAKSLCVQIVTRDRICLSSLYSLYKLLCLCAKSFATKEFLGLHRLNELKNFATNIFLKLVC